MRTLRVVDSTGAEHIPRIAFSLVPFSRMVTLTATGRAANRLGLQLRTCRRNPAEIDRCRRVVEKPFAVGEDAHAGTNSATATRVINWLFGISRLLTHSFIHDDGRANTKFP